MQLRNHNSHPYTVLTSACCVVCSVRGDRTTVPSRDSRDDVGCGGITEIREEHLQEKKGKKKKKKAG